MVNGDKSYKFFVLIQSAQDLTTRLFNSESAKRIGRRSYYYDCIEQYDKVWKTFSRVITKGNIDDYRESFCNSCDKLEPYIIDMRNCFVEKCRKNFIGDVDLLSDIITIKFVLQLANETIREIYGNDTRSRAVDRVMDALDNYGKKIKIHAESKSSLIIDTDTDKLREFESKLNEIIME